MTATRRLIVNIVCDSADLTTEDDEGPDFVALGDVLERLGHNIGEGIVSFPTNIRDANGNTVGTAELVHFELFDPNQGETS